MEAKAHSRVCTILLRLTAMAATVSAAAVMAASHQTATFLSITFKAEFYQTPSFTDDRFFLVANVVAGAYGLLTLFILRAGRISRWAVVLDLIVAMMLTGAAAAACAISQVGKKGNEQAGWQPVCVEVPIYCNQVMGALISGFIGLMLHTIIVLHAIITQLNHLLP